MRSARSWGGGLAALGLLGWAESARAQGCAICYNSASALGSRGIHALNQGILILLIPPLLFFLGIFAFFYRRRNVFSDTPAADHPRVSLHLRDRLPLAPEPRSLHNF
jgi:CHASE2 domain-containing sensor protein